MSLQTRFALLLALLGVAVVTNLAISVWSVGLLDREQRWANDQIGTVLGPLHDLNRNVWTASEMLGRRGIDWFASGEVADDAARTRPARDEFMGLMRDAVESINRLEEVPTSTVRSGVNTIRNLRERVLAASAAGDAWFAAGEEPDRAAALEGLYELHEVIERLEARLIRDAQFASDYAVVMRSRLTATVLSVVLVVVGFLLVAAWLFRRWVLVKAERLREAAEQLGAGHFDHRIPIEGDDELDQVGRRMNDMAGTILAMQAERIERERLAAIGEMARRVAHNIRNPLAGIRSLAELSTVEAPPDSPVVEHQHRIMRTVDRFGSWLTELLSVSSPLEVSPHPQPVRPWLAELVEALRPMAEDRGVTLVLDTGAAPELAAIDRRHLEQAVSAIVTNAIEFTPRGGAVTVTVRAGASGFWEILVEDDGPGISPQAQTQLFRPYFTTKHGGTGIGLAIAHRVVREHGGRLGAGNRPERPPGAVGAGPGAVFRLELPVVSVDEVARIGQK